MKKNHLLRKLIATILILNVGCGSSSDSNSANRSIETSLISLFTKEKSATAPIDEMDLSIFTNVEVTIDQSLASLNHIENGMQTVIEKGADGKEVPVEKDNRIRKIKISGIKVVIDPSVAPFKYYHDKYNISEIAVEAEEILIKGTVKLSKTKVFLVADKVTFTENATLDTTPADFRTEPPLISGNPAATKGNDGALGLPGGNIQITTRNLEIQGDQNKQRLIANGGKGQNGGQGRNGEDGVTNVVVRTTSVNGEDWGVVFEEKCVADGEAWHEACLFSGACTRTKVGDWERRTEQQGSDVSVADGNGKDAVPGGMPGLGGAGGAVKLFVQSLNGSALLQDSKVEAKFVSVAQGQPGNSALTYQGGKVGAPANLTKNVCVDYGSENGRLEARNFRRTKGADKVSPSLPFQNDRQGQSQLGLLESPYQHLSDSFFKQKLLYIRHLYLDRNFSKARFELMKDITKIKSFETISPSMNGTNTKYALLLQQMSMQQDYFGHSESEAPLFALDFSLDQYNTEIDRSMRVFRLTSLVLKELKSKNKKFETIEKLISQYDEIVTNESSRIPVQNSRLGELQTKLYGLKTQEKVLAQTLADLNAQIEERAKHNLDPDAGIQQFRNNVKVLSSICKVIPAYQPALTAVGTLADHMVNPPPSSDLAEWSKFMAGVQTDMNALENADSLKKSKESLDRLLGKFRPSNLNGKDLKEKTEYLKSLYDETAPTLRKLQELSEGFNRNTVGNDELQKEIERIKSQHPMFREATVRLQQYLNEKLKTVQLTSSLSKEILEATMRMQESIILSIAYSNDLIDNSSYDETSFQNAVEQMRSHAEDSLLFLYEEVRRAYEYTTLEKITSMKDLGLLRDKLEKITLGMSETDQLSSLTDFYKSSTTDLMNALNAKFRKNDGPELLLREDSATLDLSEEELQRLNRFRKTSDDNLNQGLLEISLDPRFIVSNQYNVRLSEVEIENIAFEFSGYKANPQGVGKMQFTITPGEKGVLVDRNGAEHFYEYPNNHLYTWVTAYEFHERPRVSNLFASGFTKIENKGSPSNKGILGILVDQSHVLFHSPIFSQPAALTTLRIETGTNGYLERPLKIKALRLKIHFTYSLKH